ncbi:50S ribosomal protein L21 [Brucella intermedia]|uniref:50S ribosomal protein L21 n=1 Tax=Brucella intermedia TaxID=94625 RepID=UPI00124C6140|nr:50S ribosomal protein L21 [Brucella intermedia]KAB2711894.1 50S ribosomal protein L21 [Brucella intermedia]
MPLLIVQLAVLVAVAFIIGCLLGRFVRRRNAAVPDRERTIIAAARATLPVDEKPETPKEAAAPAEAEEPDASTQPSEPETIPVKAIPEAEVVGSWPLEAESPDVDVEPVLDPGRPELLEAARRGKADDLTVINGIGRAVQGLLNAIGVFHYDQIASWNDEESRWIERNIGFPRRVEREDWIAQAAKLANAAHKASAKQADKPRKASAKPRPRRTKKAGE